MASESGGNSKMFTVVTRKRGTGESSNGITCLSDNCQWGKFSFLLHKCPVASLRQEVRRILQTRTRTLLYPKRKHVLAIDTQRLKYVIVGSPTLPDYLKWCWKRLFACVLTALMATGNILIFCKESTGLNPEQVSNYLVSPHVEFYLAPSINTWAWSYFNGMWRELSPTQICWLQYLEQKQRIPHSWQSDSNLSPRR